MLMVIYAMACGMEEAIMAMNGNEIPLTEWAIVKENEAPPPAPIRQRAKIHSALELK